VSRWAFRKIGVGGRQCDVDVADVRAGAGAGIVLDRVEANPPQPLQHHVGDGALVARRARDRGEVAEELDDAVAGAHAGASTP
jgi:hypothetical protein